MTPPTIPPGTFLCFFAPGRSYSLIIAIQIFAALLLGWDFLKTYSNEACADFSIGY